MEQRIFKYDNKKTLEEILAYEKEHRHEEGDFGINACKESIVWAVHFSGKSLYVLLEEYVQRANTERFFNNAMVLACWELINDKK